MPKKFKNIDLPVFFPDATRAVLRTLDSRDIENTKTPGILVNTYHLFLEVGGQILKKHGGVKNFMNYHGGVISDSGGFQVMSLVIQNGMGRITDEGVIFRPTAKKKILLTPEKSVAFQMKIKSDMVVVLDDFTPPGVSKEVAERTVKRTLEWAKRSKDEFERICKEQKLEGEDKPYLLGVVQGGDYQDVRAYCAQELVKLGFDGLGYGGWPIKMDKSFDYETAKTIAENTPDGYFLYGLGIGKPDEVVALARMGYNIFDCVLPTRDARHKRLYVFNADSIDQIDVNQENFFSYFVPTKQKYASDLGPVSKACDCLLCTNYSKSYFAHLWRIKDISAMRLATIHNLRFYSLLMEKLKAVER